MNDGSETDELPAFRPDPYKEREGDLFQLWKVTGCCSIVYFYTYGNKFGEVK